MLNGQVVGRGQMLSVAKIEIEVNGSRGAHNRRQENNRLIRLRKTSRRDTQSRGQTFRRLEFIGTDVGDPVVQARLTIQIGRAQTANRKDSRIDASRSRRQPVIPVNRIDEIRVTFQEKTGTIDRFFAIGRASYENVPGSSFQRVNIRIPGNRMVPVNQAIGNEGIGALDVDARRIVEPVVDNRAIQQRASRHADDRHGLVVRLETDTWIDSVLHNKAVFNTTRCHSDRHAAIVVVVLREVVRDHAIPDEPRVGRDVDARAPSVPVRVTISKNAIDDASTVFLDADVRTRVPLAYSIADSQMT